MGHLKFDERLSPSSASTHCHTLQAGLFDMALKNLGFLGFLKNLKNLKSPNLGFLGFFK